MITSNQALCLITYPASGGILFFHPLARKQYSPYTARIPMTDILGKLFNSSARVKLMRLFLFNPTLVFEVKDITNRSKITPLQVRKELSLLEQADFIKHRTVSRRISRKKKKGSKKKTMTRSTVFWSLDSRFPYVSALRELLIDTHIITPEVLTQELKKGGRIKVLIAAGVFRHDPESRLDLLIVGDKLKRRVLEGKIKSFEAEIGKELSYAIFDTEEFLYRLDMYDKLVSDVLDFPHEILIDTMRLSDRSEKSTHMF